MPPKKQKEHIMEISKQAAEEKKYAVLPVYAALKASKKKSFEYRVARLLKKPVTVAYDPAAQYNLLREEWCAGLLPGNFVVAYCDLDHWLYKLVDDEVGAGVTTVNHRTRTVERIRMNPALGCLKAKPVLANTSVHEGICHGGPVADGLFSAAKDWAHGPDFQRYAELAGQQTCIDITTELPLVYAKLVAKLMMQLPYVPKLGTP